MKNLAYAGVMVAILGVAVAATAEEAAKAPAADAANSFSETVFYASKAKYKPVYGVEPRMIDAWGLAIRPAGAGGHFWLTAKDISYEYVGDVANASDEKLRKLYQEDKLKEVKLPIGGKDHFATATVFLDSKENFVITQEIKGVEPITAPSKFLFASDGGIISAWTERKHEDGTFDRSHVANAVIDESKDGKQFFGLAANAGYDRLYAANFGEKPGIEVFDGKFKPLDVKFDLPFDDNKNGVVDAGEYAPFNVMDLKTPSGENHVFVTYAKTKFCDAEGLKKKECKKGELYAGEEDTDKPGQGRLAEFTEDGKLVAVWKDDGHLSAPWGMAFAPDNFGALSGKLLVGNFGDGTIAAFDPSTHEFVDVMKTAKGKPVKIEKIWAIIFGNGSSLGDSNALYYAAGPNDEKDGKWGSLRLNAAK